MNKIVFLISFFLLFVSCKQAIDPKDIRRINGYWEIEKVVFDEGQDKVYGINESYDYFQLKTDNTGFRKKVMPQIDGSFLVNDTFENIKIRQEEGGVFFIDYSTQYGKWSDELIFISDEKMILKNKEKMECHYKKASSINFLKTDEKTK